MADRHRVGDGRGRTDSEVAGPGDRRAGIMNKVYAQAQEAVARAAADPQLAEKARQQAEQVLGAFFAQQGWSLTIRWVE